MILFESISNTKRGQLIFSMFRPVDLAILLTGVSITFILLIILSNNDADTWLKILAVFPGLVCVGLVVPVANYHNVLVAIGEIINYYSNNRNYKWRGWCAVYESEREQQLAKARQQAR